jgi:hypothetical protein
MPTSDSATSKSNRPPTIHATTRAQKRRTPMCANQPTIVNGHTINPASASAPRKPPVMAPAIDAISASAAPSASTQRSRRR